MPPLFGTNLDLKKKGKKKEKHYEKKHCWLCKVQM